MKVLLIIAGLFFTLFAAVVGFYAASDPGRDYELKYVLPIDTTAMPKLAQPPALQSWTTGQEDSPPVADGRAESGKAFALPERPPVDFGERPGAASEALGRR